MSLHASAAGGALVVLLQRSVTSAPGRAEGAEGVTPYLLHAVRFSSAELANANPAPPSLPLEAELGNPPPVVPPAQALRTPLNELAPGAVR